MNEQIEWCTEKFWRESWDGHYIVCRAGYDKDGVTHVELSTVVVPEEVQT